jgi:O-antigen/teichoic acid export membrane protein
MSSGSKTHDETQPPALPARGRLVQGMLLLGGGEMAAKVFCFLAFTRIGRLFGPERYGSLEFVLAVIVFFTLPADCGLGAYGAREIAKGRSPAPRLLAGIATLRLLLALGSYIALLATLPALPVPVRVLLAIYGLGFLLAPMQLQWLFQGHGQMQWVAAASVVRYGVFAGLIFFCLGNETTLVWIGVFECIALLTSSTLCVWVARSDLRATIAEWPPRLADLIAHLRSSWPIGLSQVSWVALWYFATVFLGLWVVNDSLGQFAASHRIVMALHTFVWMYFYNLLPTICRTAVATGKDLRGLLGPSLALTSWGGGLAALVVTLLADDLIALAYGEAYRSAGRLLAVLIWAVPAALLSGHYRYALVACDHEQLEFRCNAIAAAVAIALGVLLIPAYGAFAAALALVASAFVVLVLAHAAAREAGVLVPSIALAFPAWSALAAGGIVARCLSDFGSWVAAGGAACAYLSLLVLSEFRRVVPLRVPPVDPSPSSPR